MDLMVRARETSEWRGRQLRLEFWGDVQDGDAHLVVMSTQVTVNAEGWMSP